MCYWVVQENIHAALMEGMALYPSVIPIKLYLRSLRPPPPKEFPVPSAGEIFLELHIDTQTTTIQRLLTWSTCIRCSLRLAMISVDEGVIPWGNGMGCSFTAPSPSTPNIDDLITYSQFSLPIFYNNIHCRKIRKKILKLTYTTKPMPHNLPISFKIFTSSSRLSIFQKREKMQDL